MSENYNMQVDCGAQCTQGGHSRRTHDETGRLTLTVKKEASGMWEKLKKTEKIVNFVIL